MVQILMIRLTYNTFIMIMLQTTVFYDNIRNARWHADIQPYNQIYINYNVYSVYCLNTQFHTPIILLKNVKISELDLYIIYLNLDDTDLHSYAHFFTITLGQLQESTGLALGERRCLLKYGHVVGEILGSNYLNLNNVLRVQKTFETYDRSKQVSQFQSNPGPHRRVNELRS